MRNILTALIVMGFSLSVIAQTYHQPKLSCLDNGSKSLTFIPIGSSGNAYGFAGNPRTYLWADPRIDAVVFTHRMVVESPEGNSRIAYDVSTERGAEGSWTNNIKVYDPFPSHPYNYLPARYPQGGIYNPPGNTDPDNAFYAYFAPILDDSNEIWGGYGYGINRLTEIDPPEPTQHNEKTSGGDIWRYIPNAFTITQDGYAWLVDGSFKFPDFIYTGNLIIDKGTFNADSSDYEYEEWLMPVLEEGDSISDIKVAFSPDGQTGYICLLTNSASDPVPYTLFHPILLVTQDGGDTWTVEPLHCQLGGPGGLSEVKQFIPDSMFIPPIPDRDSLYYSMGWHLDMAVDKYGDAHITGLIAVADKYGDWYPSPYTMGTFHLSYDISNNTWDGTHLYYNRTFEGDLGGITHYNRPQISSDINGELFCISWTDTHLDGFDENTYPDIYCVGYYILDPQYTETYNVTAFTQAMWTAYYGSQSHYIFVEEGPNVTEYHIPFVYTELNPEDPMDPVDFWYIDGFHFSLFTFGLNENIGQKALLVEQNHPNPFSTNSIIKLELDKRTKLRLEIYNLIGQRVFEEYRGEVSAGTYEFELNALVFGRGIYLYTVIAGEGKVTKRMVIN